MTPEQRRLARHALGLDLTKRSYRNRYAAGIGSPQEAAWYELESEGLAERAFANGLTFAHFRLTKKGARMVLEQGETLDPEDFPEATAANSAIAKTERAEDGK